MANSTGYTGWHNSQLTRENFIYNNVSGQLGIASTVMLTGPVQMNGTRVTLSAYILNTHPSLNRTVTLRLVPMGGNDSMEEDFFYKDMAPKETLILPLIIIKGGQILKGLAEAGSTVNFFINYKEEL
jgi:hypothetical protein